MLNGKKNGHGVFTWIGGNTYQGDWKDDVMSGFGIFKITNGNSSTFKAN